ncbi:MAG: hypothetical protein DRR00_30450 [Candidatus Parabeggiatoa sp. nov. 3]|nr:MAG: hypothetical protein DRR00_30450 [Gammaproteobacteria bacterium]RKZ69657.1 MAG: hypothetical protein DRQ99_00235 [Gammaproteobacteria bacterium]
MHLPEFRSKFILLPSFQTKFILHLPEFRSKFILHRPDWNACYFREGVIEIDNDPFFGNAPLFQAKVFAKTFAWNSLFTFIALP